jgi:spermidine/putrescine transport system substrate-binding protein
MSVKKYLSAALFAAGLALAPLMAQPAHAESGVLHIYNWSDYTAPDLIAKFTKETGIKVTLDTYDSNETLLAKMKAGGSGYDIIVVSNDFVPIFVKQKLIQPIDAAAMPNFKNLDPRWQNRDWDPKAEYTVPWQWGTTSFAYDAKVYPGPVDSLATLFNPPREFGNNVGMFGSPSEVISLALLYMGKPQCNTNPEDLKALVALLKTQKPRVKIYSSDGVFDRLASGDTSISEIWSGAAFRARSQRASIRYVYPKEGVIGWMDNIAVPAGAPDLENAKKFINFMMDPQNAALETNFAGYSNAVPASVTYVTPALASSPELNPPKDAKMVFATVCPAQATKDYDRVWTLIRQ